MPKLNPYRQTQLVIWINQILFFGFLILLFEPWMIIVSFFGMYIFGFMSESSLHRFFTHKSYETSNFKEKILVFFAFITGQGPTLSWVTVHRTHHAFEETHKDPHSPFHIPWWKIYLALLPNKYKNNLILDLLKHRFVNYFVLENKYYLYMWALVWIASYLINFQLFFFIVAGSAVWYIGTCIVNIVAHSQGQKKFTESVAYNNKMVNFLTGVGNHNNHHKFPKNLTYKVDNELDIYAFAIRKLFL